MREPATQREIVVPGDMRVGRSRAKPAAGRKPALAARPRAGAGEFAAAAAGVGRWIVGTCLRRPGETAGGLVAVGAAFYVALNALGFQDGRHPAPILPQPAAEASAAAAKAPAARPIAAKPAGEQALREKLEAHAAPKDAPRRDGIGEIIRGAEDTTASVSPKPDKDIARAQRALTKLGYGPLKDDGMIGPGTKAALEKFERERKLPVKGEASGRTLRELVALADKKKG